MLKKNFTTNEFQETADKHESLNGILFKEEIVVITKRIQAILVEILLRIIEIISIVMIIIIVPIKL